MTDTRCLCLISTQGKTTTHCPVSNGNLRQEMRFRVPLPHTTTLIIYACYDSILEINCKRSKI
ncbi:hypothetical protein LDENG_00208070 [Lucifuga dentata]|nr:hypothetical protein LDENG_00208070 [Lucifuga dentata]